MTVEKQNSNTEKKKGTKYIYIQSVGHNGDYIIEKHLIYAVSD